MARETKEIWIFGGTGDVGQRLVQLINRNMSSDYPGLNIILVSRSGKSSETDGNDTAKHVSFDVSRPETALLPSQNSIIINLTENTTPETAAELVSLGHIFIETSASPEYIEALKLSLASVNSIGMAILFAGASPGLTNLMAAHIASKYPSTSNLDIALELGLGRGHGGAGVRWFLEALAKPYPVIVNNLRKTAHVGDFHRRFKFEQSDENRLAIGFGFAEQLAIAEKTQALSTVRLFIALDPSWTLKLVQLCLMLGLGNLIARKSSAIAKLLARNSGIGKVRTRFLVEGTDDRGNLTSVLRIISGDQADVTALVVMTLLKNLVDPAGKQERGLFDITDILSLETVVSALKMDMPQTTMVSTSDLDIPRNMNKKRNYT